MIGAFAWPLRYFVYALQKPVWLVLISNSFHGIGFAFVFVTSYIYIDRVAPKDIRASAQSLLTLLTLGVGNLFGTWFCAWLKDHYTVFVADPAHPGKLIPSDNINWPMIFLVSRDTDHRLRNCLLAYFQGAAQSGVGQRNRRSGIGDGGGVKLTGYRNVPVSKTDVLRTSNLEVYAFDCKLREQGSELVIPLSTTTELERKLTTHNLHVRRTSVFETGTFPVPDN